MSLSPLFKTILTHTKQRLAERKQKLSIEDLRARVRDADEVRSLRHALQSRPFSVIAEHKRRSPTGGDMNEANVRRAYAAYQVPWVSAISVLTDVDHFRGSLEDLDAARAACPKAPILRKDFIVDEYQIWEARAHGADAVLLMVALHADNRERLQELFDLTESLGMDALVEIGMGGDDPTALARIAPPTADIWGVNSRKFEGSVETAEESRKQAATSGTESMVSLSLHAKLRNLIPSGKIAIAESGIHTAQDLRSARDNGYQAALIGTAFLKDSRSIDDVVSEFSTVFASGCASAAE
jgi:indole-3-glycerol phosphate synthase